MTDAFDAEPGTVWLYRHVFDVVISGYKTHDVTEETLFVVLPNFSDEVEEQHQGTMFRQYLDLETGEVQWFARDSHMNKRSTKFA